MRGFITLFLSLLLALPLQGSICILRLCETYQTEAYAAEIELGGHCGCPSSKVVDGNVSLATGNSDIPFSCGPCRIQTSSSTHQISEQRGSTGFQLVLGRTIERVIPLVIHPARSPDLLPQSFSTPSFPDVSKRFGVWLM
ncbi:MAG: hypothetical protein AAGH40_05695 [Verrucomicrobiota bacterium]